MHCIDLGRERQRRLQCLLKAAEFDELPGLMPKRFNLCGRRPARRFRYLSTAISEASDMPIGHRCGRSRSEPSAGVVCAQPLTQRQRQRPARMPNQALYESKASGRNRVTVWEARSEVAMG
jgi:hypothetical protein